MAMDFGYPVGGQRINRLWGGKDRRQNKIEKDKEKIRTILIIIYTYITCMYVNKIIYVTLCIKKFL